MCRRDSVQRKKGGRRGREKRCQKRQRKDEGISIGGTFYFLLFVN
jgi:hypothetical protein